MRRAAPAVSRKTCKSKGNFFVGARLVFLAVGFGILDRRHDRIKLAGKQTQVLSGTSSIISLLARRGSQVRLIATCAIRVQEPWKSSPTKRANKLQTYIQQTH